MPNTQLLMEMEQVFQRLFRKKISDWNKTIERDLSGSQALILENLQGGKKNVSELAECLDITSGAITSLCDKMVSAGLVKRGRTQKDRRVVYVTITEEGSAALQTVRQQRQRMVERMYGNLPEADIHHLIRIYNIVLDNLEVDIEAAERGT